MDFAVVPPEVVSAQMYAGPGAESLLSAAAAWDTVAVELDSAASSYRSAIDGLSLTWRGPSAAAMTAAAAPYLQWLSATAMQAADLAVRATAAAEAYADAFAATVPPAVIAANRAELAMLTATNLFGQNTAAIAAVEARYAQLWVQDATAMYAYSAASAMAVPPAPFAPPPETAAPGSALPQFDAGLDGALGGLVGASSATGLYEQAFAATGSLGKLGSFASIGMSAPNLGMVQFKTFFKPQVSVVDLPRSALGAALRDTSPVAAKGLGRIPSAAAGSADLVGRLSVPPSWASTAPAIRLAATVVPDTAVAGRSPLPAIALGNAAGSALGGAAPRVLNATVVRGAGGTGAGTGRTPIRLDRVITQLQQQPGSVRHWNVDEAGFDDLVTELSKKPGIHTVHLSAESRSTPT